MDREVDRRPAADARTEVAPKGTGRPAPVTTPDPTALAAPRSGGPFPAPAGGSEDVLRGDLREDLNLVYDSRERRKYPLDDLPLIVLTRGAGNYPQMPGSSFTPEQLDEHRKRLQADLVQLSRRGKQIIAPKSGHQIHRDAPELVVNAIREVVEAARGER